MPNFMIIKHLLLEKNILKVFVTVYGRGGHLYRVTLTIYLNFRSSFPGRLYIILALLGLALLEEKIFENG